MGVGKCCLIIAIRLQRRLECWMPLLLVAAALNAATSLTTAASVAGSSVVVGVRVGGGLDAGGETAGAHVASGFGLRMCQRKRC